MTGAVQVTAQEVLLAQWHERAAARIEASPDEHVAAMVAVLTEAGLLAVTPPPGLVEALRALAKAWADAPRGQWGAESCTRRLREVLDQYADTGSGQ